MEGTFPSSRQVIERVFGGIELAPRCKADILGGTAARLLSVAVACDKARAQARRLSVDRQTSMDAHPDKPTTRRAA